MVKIALILISLALVVIPNVWTLQSYVSLRRLTTQTSLSSLHAQRSKPKRRNNANVEQYLRMKELDRLRREGASYDELKAFSINGSLANATFSSTNVDTVPGGKKPSYERLLGKGSLDKRLRAIVAYKRASNSFEGSKEFLENSMTSREEDELAAMMDMEDENELSDGEGSDSDEIDEEDEEALYESMVLRAIERNKLEQVRQNIMGEEAAASSGYVSVRTDANTAPSNITTASADESKEEAKEEDMYVPAVSTWGVYKRPRNITKAYGGGRVLTKQDMDAMAEEMERQQEAQQAQARKYLTDAMQRELEHLEDIQKALKNARAYMRAGSCKEAVASLEAVREFVSVQTEKGSELLLELGMALETVDRVDEARQIYGQLAATSWSHSARRHAVQLLSGLDILKQIRKDPSYFMKANGSVGMDSLGVESIRKTLDKGVASDWDADKKDKWTKNNKYSYWFDELNEGIMEGDESQITTLKEAYGVVLKEIHPLKTVQSASLLKALQLFHQVSHVDKLAFIAGKRPLALLNDQPFRPGNLSDIWVAVNGSWDLVSSVIDAKYPTARRSEPGAVRTVLDVFRRRYVETNVVMWGFRTVTIHASLDYAPQTLALAVSSESLKNSGTPWLLRRSSQQTLQIVYCDDLLMLTRQSSETQRESDLFSLWKRTKPVTWNKY